MTDTTTPASAALAAFEHADWQGLQQGPYVVYLLAYARRDAFYIDVASDLRAIEGRCRHLVAQQRATLPEPGVRALLMTWFEVCNDPAAAQARANEIRRWTHAWQRRLVETLNPQWLDLAAYALGFPGKLAQVGERQVQFSTILNSGDR